MNRWLLTRWLPIALLMLGLAAPLPAEAAIYTWNGPSGGAWDDVANWAPAPGFPAGIPNGPDDTAIVNGGASPLAIAVPITIRPILRQLQINGATGLISIVGVNSALSLAPLDGQPAVDFTGPGGLVINTGLSLGRPFAIVRTGSA